MSTSKEIRVHPSQVQISDYSPNKDYCQTVVVQNISRQAVNIGIIEPANTKTSGFTLVSSTTSVYSHDILSDPNFQDDAETVKSNPQGRSERQKLGKKVAAGLETSFKIKFRKSSAETAIASQSQCAAH